MKFTEWSKAIRIARQYGCYKCKSGCMIVWTGKEFSVRDKNGNTIDCGSEHHIKSWMCESSTCRPTLY